MWRPAPAFEELVALLNDVSRHRPAKVLASDRGEFLRYYWGLPIESALLEASFGKKSNGSVVQDSAAGSLENQVPKAY
jgi:hypothetical protein